MAAKFYLDIKDRFTIVPKKKDCYSSFPTIVRLRDKIWMAYRSADRDKKIVHGFKGEVRLLSCSIHEPRRWQDHGLLFKPGKRTANEIDAIISSPDGNRLFLSTRDYRPGKGWTVFLSAIRAEDMTGGSMDFKRTPLEDISDTRMVCFGHVRSTGKGGYLMPGYADSPQLLYSKDKGKSWELRSILADSETEGVLLTEFSLARAAKGQWTALIRNETPPYHLMQVKSGDNGRTWSRITPTPLLGHAPMVINTLESNLMVLYRDLSGDQPGIGIGMRLDRGEKWEYAGALAGYTGSIYDGGYGDILELEKNLFLAVYYLCDEDGSPWIDGALFSILK